MYEHIDIDVKCSKLRIRFYRLLDLIAGWSARRRQRRDLSGLADYLLRDIGLSRADVDCETTKPFWKI